MAGYSKKPLFAKLGIEPGLRMFAIDYPLNYFKLLKVEPASFETVLDGSFDFIHIFVTEKKSVSQIFLRYKKHLRKDGTIWISWPKQRASFKSDINERVIRDVGLKSGLVDVKIATFDETWSALKFVYRLKDRGKVVMHPSLGVDLILD